MVTQLYRRVDLAVAQLDVALRLFLAEESFVAALTLAGAAEEVLGTALTHQGGEPALRQKFVAMSDFNSALRGQPLQWISFHKGENLARNAAKHMRVPKETTIEVDMQAAAMWMLVRACANYDRLNFPQTDRMREFDDWFFDHVVGI